MQEEPDSVMNQRTQNVRDKKSFYTIKLLPKRKKDYEMPAVHVQAVVEEVENLGVRSRPCICVCECVCE